MIRAVPTSPAVGIDEAAARWALRSAAPGFGGSAALELERWLEADERHRLSFAEALATLSALDAHAAAPALLELRAVALSAAPPPRRVGARFAFGGLAAALALLVLTPLAMSLSPSLLAVIPGVLSDETIKSYQTAVGERATIALPDGSVMTLDTASKAEVRFSTRTRKVVLLRGQALFEVAKHQNRPFQVFASNRRITAVGTKFNVRVETGRLQVALLEGVVRVEKPSRPEISGDGSAVQMVSGEVLETRPDDTITIRADDVARSAGWRDGVLILDDETLEDAVREMNRYTTAPIRLAPRLGARFRLSGVYKTGDPERFSRAMTEIFPLTLSRGPDGNPLLSPR
jgi:transmembrane sensor